MTQVPLYQQGQIASSDVGTPGVDSSGYQLGQDIASDANAVRTQAYRLQIAQNIALNQAKARADAAQAKVDDATTSMEVAKIRSGYEINAANIKAQNPITPDTNLSTYPADLQNKILNSGYDAIDQNRRPDTTPQNKIFNAKLEQQITEAGVPFSKSIDTEASAALGKQHVASALQIGENFSQQAQVQVSSLNPSSSVQDGVLAARALKVSAQQFVDSNSQVLTNAYGFDTQKQSDSMVLNGAGKAIDAVAANTNSAVLEAFVHELAKPNTQPQAKQPASGLDLTGTGTSPLSASNTKLQLPKVLADPAKVLYAQSHVRSLNAAQEHTQNVHNELQGVMRQMGIDTQLAGYETLDAKGLNSLRQSFVGQLSAVQGATDVPSKEIANKLTTSINTIDHRIKQIPRELRTDSIEAAVERHKNLQQIYGSEEGVAAVGKLNALRIKMKAIVLDDSNSIEVKKQALQDLYGWITYMHRKGYLDAPGSGNRVYKEYLANLHETSNHVVDAYNSSALRIFDRHTEAYQLFELAPPKKIIPPPVSKTPAKIDAHAKQLKAEQLKTTVALQREYEKQLAIEIENYRRILKSEPTGAALEHMHQKSMVGARKAVYGQ